MPPSTTETPSTTDTRPATGVARLPAVGWVLAVCGVVGLAAAFVCFAFRLLRGHARDHNHRLTELARAVVAGRDDLPRP